MGIKLLGGFFIVISGVSIFHIASSFETVIAKGNQTYTVHIVLYTVLFAVTGFITAIGLFRLKQWARKLAVILLIVKTAQVIIGLVEDVLLMIENSVGMAPISAGVVLILIILTVMAFLIAYLNRDVIRNQFH